MTRESKTRNVAEDPSSAWGVFWHRKTPKVKLRLHQSSRLIGGLQYSRTHPHAYCTWDPLGISLVYYWTPVCLDACQLRDDTSFRNLLTLGELVI